MWIRCADAITWFTVVGRPTSEISALAWCPAHVACSVLNAGRDGPHPCSRVWRRRRKSQDACMRAARVQAPHAEPQGEQLAAALPAEANCSRTSRKAGTRAGGGHRRGRAVLGDVAGLVRTARRAWRRGLAILRCFEWSRQPACTRCGAGEAQWPVCRPHALQTLYRRVCVVLRAFATWPATSTVARLAHHFDQTIDMLSGILHRLRAWRRRISGLLRRGVLRVRACAFRAWQCTGSHRRQRACLLPRSGVRERCAGF